MFSDLAIPKKLIDNPDAIGAYYMRVSTQEQSAAKADPLGRQRLNLDTSVGAALGTPEDNHIYIDRQSGKKDDRPKLLELLAVVEAQAIQWVACDRVDRIGRSIQHNMKLWGLFQKSGVQLFIFEWAKFVNFSPYQGSEDWDPFVRDSIRAEQESRTKGKRAFAAHQYSRHLRKANYIMPFGYVRDEDGKTYLDLDTLDIAIARRDIYLELGSARATIAKLFEDHGHKVSGTGLVRWLCNPVLRGHTPRSVNQLTTLPELRYQNIDYNTHPEQALLSEEQYQRILELRRRQHGGRTQKSKLPTPLAGLCRCALCGYTLTQIKWTGKTKTNRYLTCHGRRTRAPESGCWHIPRDEWSSIRYEVVELAVQTELSKRAADLAEAAVGDEDSDDIKLSAEELKITAQIEQLEKLQRDIVGSDFSKDIERLRGKLERPEKSKPNRQLVAELTGLFAVAGPGSFLSYLKDSRKYDIYHRFVDEVMIDRGTIIEIKLLI